MSCNPTKQGYSSAMARQLRIEYPGAVYHVTSRGNARQKIYADADDRKTFLKIFGQVIVRYRWACHAYCLMGNHILCGALHKMCYVKRQLM
jgi:REP element-mobilizing transposase RayT